MRKEATRGGILKRRPKGLSEGGVKVASLMDLIHSSPFMFADLLPVSLLFVLLISC